MRVAMMVPMLIGYGLAQASGTLSLGAATGKAIDGRGLSGTVLPVWGNLAKYTRMSEGLRRGGFSLFRFPNGTLSNEYHWNGAGRYDTLGIWQSQDSLYQPGFLADLLHRGTTRANYGANFPSQVFDGDTATFWWGAGGTQAPPWFVADFRTPQVPDSLEILWGEARPSRVRVESFRGSDDHGQGPHTAMTGAWREVGTDPVKSGRSVLRLAQDSSRYLALRFEGSGAGGVQVREVRAWSKGMPLSRNVASVREQTRGIGLGTAPSNERKRAWQPRDWDFETYMATLAKELPGSDPLICVNLGTGTPEEAAAWVHYANKVRKYGIRRWQVGNEIDGDWEDGGPLDAAQVAERFLAFARAMKREDSTIKVLGPVYASMDRDWCGSGRLDGLSWMEAFLRRVGDAERKDGRQWLDGVDFHAYPFWWPDGEMPKVEAMLPSADRLGLHLDTLIAMMGRNLSNSQRREVSMSEYNATVKATHYTLTQHTGTLVALMLGHLATRLGDRALACLWEPSGGEPMNPDGTSGSTYGSLRLFTPGRRGLASDLAEPPTGAFWGAYLTKLWMGEPADSLSPMPVTVTGASDIRAFGLGRGKRASVLLVNLGGHADTVRIPVGGAGSPSSMLLTWGAEEYSWDGDGMQARAFPNGGPVSRPWRSGEAIVVPPYGTALLAIGTESVLHRPQILHRVLTSTVLHETDTLGLCLSACQRGGHLVAGRWRLDGGNVRPLFSLDGGWDGSHEMSLLSLPARSLGSGVHRIDVEIEGENGSFVRDSVRVEVTGQPRTNAWIDCFEGAQPDWFAYVHKDPSGSRLDLSLAPQPDTAGGNGKFLSFEFAIRQPNDLSYPNFVTAGLELDAKALMRTKPAGIVFDYAAQYEAGDGLFSLSLLSDRVLDYDHHRIVLAPTGGRWKRDTVWFDAFAQEGWGKPLGSLDFSTVSKVELRAQGGGSGTLKFDNFCLIGTDGEMVRLPPVPVSPRRRGR